VLSPDKRIEGPVDVGTTVEAAPDGMMLAELEWSPQRRFRRIDFVARDAYNRSLGRRGEEFVIEFERQRLHDSGQRHLLARLEWTSELVGDGAGYDIRSFNSDETERLIEVKTTGLGKYFPFVVTANEVACSQAKPQAFHLYRVFDFSKSPRLYVLPGDLGRSCRLRPTQYRAFVGQEDPTP
jgi:hypothetical protein